MAGISRPTGEMCSAGGTGETLLELPVGETGFGGLSWGRSVQNAHHDDYLARFSINWLMPVWIKGHTLQVNFN